MPLQSRLILLPLLLSTGCQTLAEDEYVRSNLLVAVTPFANFEAEQTLQPFGLTGSGDVDYTSFEVGFGATTYRSMGEGVADRKISRAEFRIGRANFSEDGGTFDLDAFEFAGGGRFFFEGRDGIAPFVGIHSVATWADEQDGFSLGSQLGLRLGAGVEFELNESVAADFGLDYTLPLLAAESDSVGGASIDTEVSGLALRIGLVFTF